MRRLALAGGVALTLHALLFALGSRWQALTMPEVHIPRSVAVSLRTRPPAPQPEPVPAAAPPQPEPLPSRERIVAPLPAPPEPKKRPIERQEPPAVLEPRPTEPTAAPPTPRPSVEQPTAPAPTPAAERPETEPAVDAPRAAAVTVREARPLYRRNPPPAYPAVARRRGWQGVVLLSALIDEEGRVQELAISRSSGYPLLDRAALRAVEEWLFEPGRRGEEPVASRVVVPVRFTLH